MSEESSLVLTPFTLDHEWWDGEGRIYLAWGILNPYGPTLYVLGARAFDGEVRTFVRGLHMLGGSTTYASHATGDISHRRIQADAAQIHDYLIKDGRPGLFHVVPSFLVADRDDAALGEVARQLLAGSAAANDDWARQVAYVRRFGVDFFGRAVAEIREYYEAEMARAPSMSEEEIESLKWIELRYGHLPQFTHAQIPASTRSTLTPELLEAWWQVVGESDHQVEALKALKAMWESAAALVSGEHRDRLVAWEKVRRFLGNFKLAVD
jgi:hypothetical protein